MKRALLILSVIFAAVAAKAQYGPYPVLPIDTVQFSSGYKFVKTAPTDSPDYVNPLKKNVTYGDTVRMQGVVLMDPKLYGLSASRKGTYIQRTGGGAWAGSLILADPGAITASSNSANNTIGGFLSETKFYDNLRPGYTVTVTGVIRQFNMTGTSFGETQVDMIHDNSSFINSVHIDSINIKTIPTRVLTIDTFMTGNKGASSLAENKINGEKYEGMYVEFQNVTVNNRTQSSTRWVWSVIDDRGNEIWIRDVSGYFRNDALEDTSMHLPHTFSPPPIGARLAYLRGAIVEASANSVSGYWLAPFTPSDIGPVTYTPPAVSKVFRNPVIATPTDSVLISARTVRGTKPVASGKLFFTVGYNSFVFDSVVMTKSLTDSTVWAAKVPNKPLGSVVKYWMRIVDSSGVYKNYPDSLGSNSAYMVTNGVLDISKLQFSPYPSGATIWNGDSLKSVDVRGIVTGLNYVSSNPVQDLITVQNGTSQNSGIFVQRSTGDPTTNWKIGDSVSITGAVMLEANNITTMNNITGSVITSGIALPVFVKNLITDSFSLNNFKYAQPYEAMLLKWDSVAVVNPNPDGPTNNFYEFTFAKDTNNLNGGMRVDDMNSSIHPVNGWIKRGMKMNFIQGPLFFSHNEYKLIPRSLNDIDFSHLDTIAPVITLKGKQYDTITVSKSYADSGATALDNIDGNVTSKIIRSGIVDSSKVGSNILTYSATDNWGNTGIAKRYVYVKLNVAVKEQEMRNALISVYPSPAQNEITVSATGIQTLPVTVQIIDIIGRQLSSKQIKQGTFTEKMDISTLPNGIYFCVINNDKGSRTIKFTVNGK